ncbi:hypothetical protein N8897_02325 [Candidatus Pelagibacter sp.]|nr:hypothetical protein [Candidatus Pelagibacter sp.]
MVGAIGILIAVSGATTLAISGTYYGNVTTPLSIRYINLLGFFVFVPISMVMA